MFIWSAGDANGALDIINAPSDPHTFETFSKNQVLARFVLSDLVHDYSQDLKETDGGI